MEYITYTLFFISWSINTCRWFDWNINFQCLAYTMRSEYKLYCKLVLHYNVILELIYCNILVRCIHAYIKKKNNYWKWDYSYSYSDDTGDNSKAVTFKNDTKLKLNALELDSNACYQSMEPDMFTNDLSWYMCIKALKMAAKHYQILVVNYQVQYWNPIIYTCKERWIFFIHNSW